MRSYECRCSECGAIGYLDRPPQPGKIRMCDRCFDGARFRSVTNTLIWHSTAPHVLQRPIPEPLRTAITACGYPN